MRRSEGGKRWKMRRSEDEKIGPAAVRGWRQGKDRRSEDLKVRA
jgi:hypothetical protein